MLALSLFNLFKGSPASIIETTRRQDFLHTGYRVLFVWFILVRCLPEHCRNSERINSFVLPPQPLVTAMVQFTVMQSTQRDGEPVADLASHCSDLSKPEM